MIVLADMSVDNSIRRGIPDRIYFFNFSVLHKKSEHSVRVYLLNWMFCDYFQPLHQMLILFRCDFHCFFPGTRPVKCTQFQPLIEKQESNPLPRPDLLSGRYVFRRIRRGCPFDMGPAENGTSQ